MPEPKYDGIAVLREATKRHAIKLSTVLAEITLWANPEVHHRLVVENESGAYFPKTRRYRRAAGEGRRQICNGELLDDNRYALRAIRQALGLNVAQFHACHIWPESCYDVRYHTAIANLVLIPSPLAGLSDYDPEIQSILQYRSYELYGWHPLGYQRPMRPDSYPNNWREPMPFTPRVAKALANRNLDYLSTLERG